MKSRETDKSYVLLIAEAVRDAFVEAMIDYFGKDAKSLRLIKVVDLPAIISSVPALEPYCYVVSGCSIPFYGEFAENDAKQEAKRVGGTCEAIPLYKSPPASEINRQLLDVETKRFLTDVITAAGLLYYGKTDKGLSSRINEHAAMLLTATAAEQQSQPEPVNKQLLDALKHIVEINHYDFSGHDIARKAIAAAEQQAQPEPDDARLAALLLGLEAGPAFQKAEPSALFELGKTIASQAKEVAAQPQPLTDDEIEALWYKHPASLPFARAILAAAEAKRGA